MEDVQLLAIGAVTVIDTVILLSMLERPNRTRMAIWMLLLMFAAWLWHVSSFIHCLLLQTTGPWAMDLKWMTRVAMCLALLMLPSGLLHGMLRLMRTGLTLRPPIERRYLAAYLPMLIIVPLSFTLYDNRDMLFMDAVGGYRVPYIAWMSIVNLAAAVMFFRFRNRSELPEAWSFFVSMAIVYLLNTVFIAVSVLYGLDESTGLRNALQLAITLSPVIPLLIFAYFCVRFRLIPLVLERTLVYGAILVGFLLFHNLVISDLNAALSDRLRIDVGIVEGIAVLALVLVYQPLRERMAEALRYLVGRRVAGVRKQTRRLSVELSEHTGDPPNLICEWLEQQLVDVHDLSFARVSVSIGKQPVTSHVPTDADRSLVQSMNRLGFGICSRRNSTDSVLTDALEAVDSSAAIVRQHADVDGLLLIGRQPFNQSLEDEDLNSVMLLFEQLLVTIRNGQLQSMRLEAERRALQNEKLSMMGLLAGSIAHEIKNPLSSIKTIASVMAEDMNGTDHAEDVQLILGEINRLSETTRDLLAFARPDDDTQAETNPLSILRQIERIVKHSARERGVTLAFESRVENAAVMASDNALKQIYFNLISNSLDAAGRDGTVDVKCARDDKHFVTTVSDNGPGISPEIQDHLFEPFQTDKVNGTGLGLYIVGQRVKELNGVIRCRSSEQGTTFEVRLPTV